MSNCKVCGGPMAALLTSTYCPRDCDRKTVDLPNPKHGIKAWAAPEPPPWVTRWTGRASMDHLNHLLQAHGQTYLDKKMEGHLPPQVDCLYGSKTLYEGRWYERTERNYWRAKIPLLYKDGESNWVNATINKIHSLAATVQYELGTATRPYKKILTLGKVPHWVVCDGHAAERMDTAEVAEIRIRAYWAGVVDV